MSLVLVVVVVVLVVVLFRSVLVEERTVVVPKNGTVVDAIVLDTFSELSKKSPKKTKC